MSVPRNDLMQHGTWSTMRNRLQGAIANVRVVVLAWALTWLGSPAARGDETPVRRGLWVDPTGVSLTDSAVRNRLLDQPVKRIIVSVFVRGETLFANQSGLFAQLAAYQGKDDALRALLLEARRKGRKVYVFFDCLRWVRPGEPEGDLLRNHPDLAEQSAEGFFGSDAQG